MCRSLRKHTNAHLPWQQSFKCHCELLFVEVLCRLLMLCQCNYLCLSSMLVFVISYCVDLMIESLCVRVCGEGGGKKKASSLSKLVFLVYPSTLVMSLTVFLFYMPCWWYCASVTLSSMAVSVSVSVSVRLRGVSLTARRSLMRLCATVNDNVSTQKPVCSLLRGGCEKKRNTKDEKRRITQQEGGCYSSSCKGSPSTWSRAPISSRAPVVLSLTKRMKGWSA